MPSRIEEKELILPALKIINENPGVTTSTLISELTDLFKPEGEDAKILEGRNDTKFSQKVRNLVSHRDRNGMDQWANYLAGKFTITEKGERKLEEYSDALDYMANNPFSYDDNRELVNAAATVGKKTAVTYKEDQTVTEGRKTKAVAEERQRSQKLRDAAVAHYTDSKGYIICVICNFDFKDVYGDLGDGYIEIHHTKPIFRHDEEGEEVFLKEAVEKVKPVCANCHRMLHRKRKDPLTIEDLKDLVKRTE